MHYYVQWVPIAPDLLGVLLGLFAGATVMLAAVIIILKRKRAGRY